MPLVAFGLAMALLDGLAGTKLSLGPGTSIIGALLGFGVLALVRFAYHRLRGREGLGLGDAKLLAAIGAWVGPVAVPMVIALGGALTLLAALLVRRRLRADTAVPLGPGARAAGWLAYLAVFA